MDSNHQSNVSKLIRAIEVIRGERSGLEFGLRFLKSILFLDILGHVYFLFLRTILESSI